MIEAIAIAGFDFAVVDMEHTPLGPRDLYPLLLAAEARGLLLIVRIPECAERYVKWCLDMGVEEIQVPNVENAAQVSTLASWSYFPGRGLCRFVRAADFSAKDGDEYRRAANERAQLVLQIESRAALVELKAIAELSPPGSTIFFGPYDLSRSLGVPGQVAHEDVVTAIKLGISVCRNAGRKTGCFADTPESARYWAEHVDMIEYGSDLQLLIGAARALKA